MRALRSATQDAEDWSALRQHEKHALDTYELVRELAEARTKAKHLEEKFASFSAFIETDDGTATLASLGTIRKGLIHILTRDVEQLIDLDFPIATRSGTFKARELIEFWGALYQIATCASVN